MDIIKNSTSASREVVSQDEMIKKAIRSDLNRRFVSTCALWPIEKERTMIFQLCRYQDIQEFPKEIFQLYKNVFNGYIHLIDVMDNCLKLRICENKECMWLPTESVSLILKFYNHGYGFNLGLKYVGEGIFFAAARDRYELDLETMYQDKYVKDVLSTRKQQKIEKVFKLSYSDVKYHDCVIVKNNVVKGQQLGSKSSSSKKVTSSLIARSRVGDGETIQLNLGKTYPKASRVYIPCNFAKLPLPDGVDTVWTVVGHSRLGNIRFMLKFVRNKSQQNAYHFAGSWRDFCTAYKSKLKKPCLLKIVFVQNKLIEASFQD